MAINHNSGRVVVDLDSELKMALHAALASEGMSLKAWLHLAASEFVAQRQQHRLEFGQASQPSPNRIRSRSDRDKP